MNTSAPTDLDLHRHAEQFLDALLDSASVSRIGVSRWWERAKTALETSAAASTSWRQCVAKAGKKMEIDVYTASSAATLAALATILDNPAMFARWRTLTTRDALTITAMVRNDRTTRKRTTPTPAEEPAL